MNFRMLRLVAIAAGCLTFFPLGGQTISQMPGDAHPKFEVATIKSSDPAHTNTGYHLEGRKVSIENQPLSNMFAFAYGIQVSQIVDAPAWFAEDRFDVDGVPDVEGQPNIKQYQEMVRQLLAERFHVQFRAEKRQLSIYALTVTKGGPKLTKSASAPDAQIDQTGNGGNGQRFMRFTNNSMGDLAMAFRALVDRPVVDQSGLAGRYDFVLRWAPEGAQEAAADAPPGLFTAVQEQLGLKLEPTKGPADVYVIERVERPSAN